MTQAGTKGDAGRTQVEELAVHRAIIRIQPQAVDRRGVGLQPRRKVIDLDTIVQPQRRVGSRRRGVRVALATLSGQAIDG